MASVTQQELVNLFKKILPSAKESEKEIAISLMGVTGVIKKPNNLETKIIRTQIKNIK